MKRFAVLTLNWNGLEVLPGMIESLAVSVEKLGGELVVFDNCSQDGSDRIAVETWGNYKWFTLIHSSENLGFAAGANCAIQDIEAEIIVLANSDTVFLPGSLEILLDAVERYPQAGIIGPKLLWPDGSLQRSIRDFPFPGKLFAEHLPFFRKFSSVNLPHDTECRVDWLVGAVMVFKKELFIKARGFDCDFFFYHEETELQYRLSREGYSSVFIPSALVTHFEGASASKMFGRETSLQYIQAKLKFLRKHGYIGSIFMFRLFMGFLQWCRLITGFLKPGLSRRDRRYTAPYCRIALQELFRRNRRDK
jgi:GT2 family glycosyltransferase